MALPRPRWETPLPDRIRTSWGPMVAAFAEAELGFPLDRWQRLAVNRALAVDPETGRLFHRHYLVSAGRQNGKTALVRALIGTALTMSEGPEWAQILGLAYDKKQAGKPYAEVLADLAPLKRRFASQLALTRYLGIRSDLYGWHREYNIGSREARDAIRTFSVDLGVFDEVRTQRNYDTWNALEPTTRARPEPIIFEISTAGDDRSVLLRDHFDRGLRIIAGAESPDGFGMTWYAAADADAGAAPGSPAFRRAINAANPAVAAGRVSFGPVAASVRSLTASGFRAETLNLWTEGVDELLPPGTWHRQRAGQPESTAGRITLAVEAVPSWRRATVIVGIETDVGAWIGVAGELDASREGAASVPPEKLRALVERLAREWHPEAVAFSAASAAAPYAKAAAEKARVPQVLALTGVQIRAASELWRSELVGGRLVHEDDALMAQQVRTARPSRPVESGDWYLSIRESLGEIDSARAGAWAAWATIAPEARRVPLQIF